MKRFHLSLAIAATLLAAAAGCGDNSKVCGPGTADSDDDGVCEPSDVPPMCSNGTILDPGTNSCVIDPSSCQNGTVLIDNRCVDPTEGLTIDLMEGAEPNNTGVGGIENSANVAGVIELKAVGQVTVVKGNINPHQDADSDGELEPDMDAYALMVNAPALLEISVDGVNGLMGAYLVVTANKNPADQWRRFGINVTGDTSKRQVYLPAAGMYVISVADTRSMFVDNDSPPAAGFGAAAGGPQANYFMSIKVVPTPAPTPLTLAGGTATTNGSLAVGEVKFFSAPAGLGINSAELDIPGTPAGSVVIGRNGAFKDEGAESFDVFTGPVPAFASAVGFRAGEQSLVVADTVYHYGPAATNFTLTVTSGDAGQLSTSGGTVTQPEVTDGFSVFYYDVAAADEVTGFSLTWNQPVGGAIADEDFAPVANFTFNPITGFTARTFTGYKGLIRHRTAGRYYFLVFDDAGTGPAQIAATSTLAPVTVATVVKGTPLTNQAVNAFESNPYVYVAGQADPWQVFDGSGTDTGNITNTFFRIDQAYGRLDALTTAGTGAIVEDAVPVFSQTYPQSGRPQGRVLIDDAAPTFFVTTNTATVAATSTFTLDFKARTFHDFGTIAAGNTANRDGESIDGTSFVRYYLLRTATNNKVTITVDPVTATLDSRARVLNRDETVRREINAPGPGQDDVGDVLQTGATWTAFSVSATSLPTETLTYNVSVAVATFTPPTYTRTAGTTAYADACAGGTTVALVPDGSGFGPANDEGFSATRIVAPAGFRLFGLLEPSFVVSTNGWLGFLNVTTAIFSNPDMPNAAVPNGVIAPFWDDLANVVVCTKTSGTKLTVQWTGNRFSQPAQTVAFQAILDGTSSTIELVWGAAHIPNGQGSTATVGIEDQTGGTANKIGFNATNTTPASTSVVFTPN